MVTVNKDTCIGCGACAATCPDVFEMKDGTVKKLEDMTDSEIEEVTGEEVTQDVYEPPEEKADLEAPPSEYNDEPPDEPKEEEGRTL